MIALPAAAVTAAAPPHLDRTAAYSAVQLFALADQARAAGRRADAEAMYRALAKDPDVRVRSEARFRLAEMLEGEKKWRDAALLLRALLDEQPGAARVRLELARVLAELGDATGARRQLRQAQASGLPPEVARIVDQFAGALRSTKPLGGSLEIALAPDTNINRATAAATLDTVIAPLTLDRDARARSGLGLRLGGQGYARLDLRPGVGLLARASGSASLYRERRFDDVSTSLVAGPELTLPRDRLRPALGYGWRYYAGRLYAQTATASLDWMHRLGARGQLEAEASAARARYTQLDLQDGAIYDGSIAVERAFGARLGGSLTIAADRQTARDPGYATTAGSATALIWRETGRFTLYGTASYRHLAADARLFLYPRTRLDDFVKVSGGVAMRKLALLGMAPLVRFGWERNRSTVGIYDYRRFAAELGITRAF